MNEQGTLTAAAPDRPDGLMKTQEAQVARLERLCGQMAQIVVTMEARLSTLENTLKTRVTITYAQSLSLGKAVQERAALLCRQNRLPEREAAKPIRAAIWRALYLEYGIRNRADLPAMHYRQALGFADGWSSFALVMRLRDRART